jgi:protoporphyrinogen oxidase
MTGQRAEVIVLGAGPAGIGAGIALGEAALVLERSADLGGLCGTLELDGAIFDLGGHSFHTPHPEIRQLVCSALKMEEQPRQAWCFVGGDWIPYPFQQHYRQLTDSAIVAECAAGLDRVDPTRASANFDEHLEHRFGAGITRHFLRPYNEKLWGRDLTRLSAEWTVERIAGTTGALEQFLPDGGKRTPLQADTRVSYPAQGGFGEIFRALARRLPRLRLGDAAVAIDWRKRRLQTANAESISWQQIVSTLPLPKLLAMLPEVPDAVRDDVARLQALPVSLVLVALDSRLDTAMQRVYCPGPEVPGHKIVINHNSSADLRSRPCHGIQVEISGHQGVGVADGKLTEQVLDGLLAIGLLRSRDPVRSTRVVNLPYGYPVPTHDRGASVARVRSWLAGVGIRSVGRFGEWAYINSDEALHRGLCVGAELARSVGNDADFQCARI